MNGIKRRFRDNVASIVSGQIKPDPSGIAQLGYTIRGKYMVVDDTDSRYMFARFIDGGFVRARHEGLIVPKPDKYVRVVTTNSITYLKPLTKEEEFYYEGGNSTTAQVGIHSHKRGTPYEFEIDPYLLGNGRTTVYEDLKVKTTQAWFWDNGAFDGMTEVITDLSSSLPGTASTWYYVTLSIDPATNAIEIEEGTEKSIAIPLLMSDVPVPDAENICLCAIKLRYGQTEVYPADIIDLRGSLISQSVATLQIGEMVGATSGDDGASGLVPQPVAGDQTRFLRGDATWAEVAGGGTAVEPLALLDSEVVGSAVSSVTLTIPSGYKHLLVMYKVKSTRTDDTDTNLKVQFNSDTGSNYGWLNDLRRVTTPATAEDTSDPHIPIPVVGSQSSPTNQANFWTTGQFRINNYADTDNYKILDNTNDWYRSATSFGMHRVTGVWKNTAAITSITLTMTTGDIAVGSSFYVYGIGDATNDLYYQTVNVNGSSLTQRSAFNFLSGTGITVSGADDAGNDESEITAALNFNGLSAAAIDGAADYLAFYDASGATHSKLLFNTLFGAPPAIGGVTPAAGTFTALRANGDLTLAGAPTKIKPASDSTTAIQVANAAGTAFVRFDTTNRRVIIGDQPTYGADFNFIIKGTSTANNPSIYLEHYNTAYNRWSIGNVNGDFSIGQDTVSTPFSIYSGAKTAMLVIKNNNVGINNSSPTAELHVITTDPDKVVSKLQGHASQSANFLSAIDPSGNVLAAIGAKGAGAFAPRDTATNAITAALTLGHNTSGTPAANYGVSMVAQLENPSSEDVEVGRDVWLWNTATHASRKPDRVFYLTDSGGEREILRMRANGSAGAVGFFGVAPVGQQTGGAASAGASYGATEQTMLQAVYDALRAFGLIS